MVTVGPNGPEETTYTQQEVRLHEDIMKVIGGVQVTGRAVRGLW